MLKLTTRQILHSFGTLHTGHRLFPLAGGTVRSVPDSLISEYTTRAGRKVYDGGGIMPDIRTEPEYISRFAMTLYALGFIEDFGDEYVRRHPGQQIDIRTFSITDGDYAEFAEFMKDKEVPYESDTRRALKKLREAAKTDRFEEVEQQIAAIDRRSGRTRRPILKLTTRKDRSSRSTTTSYCATAIRKASSSIRFPTTGTC